MDLRRRASKSARRGELRKSARTLRELVALEGRPPDWARLGYILDRAGRADEALDAYRQALFLFRRFGDHARARSVANRVLAHDPDDRLALRAQRHPS